MDGAVTVGEVLGEVRAMLELVGLTEATHLERGFWLSATAGLPDGPAGVRVAWRLDGRARVEDWSRSMELALDDTIGEILVTLGFPVAQDHQGRPVVTGPRVVIPAESP